MVMRSVDAQFESDGARRVVEVAMVGAAEAVAVARAALTVVKMATCQEIAPNPGKEVVVEEAEIASTAASLDTCPETARNPRSQESLVVVAAVVADASTAGKTDTCRVNAQSRRSRESPDVLEADLLAGMIIEFVVLVPLDDVAPDSFVVSLNLTLTLNICIFLFLSD